VAGSRSKGYRAPQSAEELVSRYLKGERSFPKTTLREGYIETSLPGIDLSNSLLRVLFNDVDLTGASFRGADLVSTYFDGNLRGCNFEGADLAWTNFGRSNVENGNFRAAQLRCTQFQSARLDHCDFTHAQLEETILLDVSIVSLCECLDVKHEAPSYVDYRTIIRSIRSPRLKDFLLRIGTPGVFVEYMVDCARSMTESSMSRLLQSTFISYGAPNEVFARRLYEALHTNGVRTFFFPEHGIPGKKLHRMMRDGVNEFDRVILICSLASLSRRGVLNEIEETLQREARDGGASYLIPVRLDDSIFDPGTLADEGIARAIRDRVVADFTDLEGDPGKFDRSLQKLVSSLKKDSPLANDLPRT
jgi:hypothetical protein